MARPHYRTVRSYFASDAALPALRVLQKDEDEGVQQAAAAAVKEIEAKGP